MEFSFILSEFFSAKLIIFIIICCLIFILNVPIRTKCSNPPGPNIFQGSLQLFKPFAYKYLHELIKKHGPVVQLSIFGQHVIIFGNYDVIQEAFIKNEDYFLDRITTPVIREYCKNKGLIFTNGEFWREQKKFAMSHLLRSGFQESYDKIILEEIELAFNAIQEKKGTSFDPKQLFLQMTANIIMCMTASARNDYRDESYFIVKTIEEITYNTRATNPVHFVPYLEHILKSHKNFKKNLDNLREYLTNLIEEHESSFDANNLRDYIDAFILKMHEDEVKGNSNTTFTKEQLISSLVDFFVAGGKTTSFTILYAILYLLHHPNIQRKIQKEIDEVIGSSRYPVMDDCSKLPFTHATILETQRLSSIAPLAGARLVLKNFKIECYDIPKGAYVLPLIYSMHLDPKYWNNPLNFDPERFLDRNREMKKNIKSFSPFFIGHRQCMGEALARSELFLIFTSLLQRYSLKSSSDLPSMTESLEGSALCPLPFTVSFIPR